MILEALLGRFLETYYLLTTFFRSAEGVQLLCMIDKGLDACRYLQTYGKWDEAAWLAKVLSFVFLIAI